MCLLYYDDRSGELITDMIWEFNTPEISDEDFERGQAYGTCTSYEVDEVFGCPEYKYHRTDIVCRSATVDVFGEWPGVCLPLSNHGFNIASEEFAQEFKRSGLTGVMFRPSVKVSRNYSDIKKPDFVLMDVVGKGGIGRRFKLEGIENKCPYCDKEPIYCPGCSLITRFCHETNAPLLGRKAREYASPGIPVIDTKFSEKRVVDAKTWDGSDWFVVKGDGGGWFISQRAKAWLESIDARGIRLTPALLNVDKD